MGQPHAAAARGGLPGRPTGGLENSFTEQQMFYDVAGSIFVAGWSEGFLGGRERSHWVLNSYIFFTIRGDADSRGGETHTKPDLYSERSHWVLNSYIFFTIGGDADSRGGGPVRGRTRRGVIGF